MTPETENATKAGNYFVANYPPFSFWNEDGVAAALRVLDSEPEDDRPLGVYVHVPFCRKRCDFCYFKVYTDKNAGEIERYLDAVRTELAAHAARPRIRGREPAFVYFGGGTPSYLSSKQMRILFDGLRSLLPWRADAEVTFECEPGTLQRKKLEMLHELGVTRLSLGVENFDPDILELNNRAHRAKEIYDVFAAAREIGFPQINIDLIAGMVGETDANWTRCLDETVRLLPDSVTVYQMEVPHNTTLFQRMQDGRTEVAPVADWETKRRWVTEGFERLERAGYRIGSAYTAARGEATFVYRDSLWHGADLLGVGVSSFSHVGGVHFQNDHAFESYVRRVEAGEAPFWRGMPLSDDERLVRELVLQMKLGDVDTAYFKGKFGVDVLARYAPQLERHAREGWLAVEGDRIRASREGLLRIDSLLPDYFLEEHRDARYW